MVVIALLALDTCCMLHMPNTAPTVTQYKALDTTLYTTGKSK